MTFRKILFSAAAVTLVAAVSAPAAAAPAPTSAQPTVNLVKANAVQKGQSLVLVARTTRAVNLKRLTRFPDLADNRRPYLCFRITRPARGVERQLCLGGAVRPRQMIGLMRLAPGSSTPDVKRRLRVKIKRPARTKLVITLSPGDIGLAPSAYRWQLTARQGGKRCRPGRPTARCFESIPTGKRGAKLEIRPTLATGCTAGATGLVRNGPRNRRLVALTFDDGPGIYTAGFLDVLKRKQVRGTFYVLGQNTAAYPALARRIVTEGHEIANHSWKHDLYPGYGDLSQTSATIRSITGFKPCTFRPPGGAQNAGVVAGAGRAGMKTVLWDVDPFDWRLPGADAIRRIIISGTRPGSIVLSHDGGGNRSQTLAALPGIIDNLKSRGYRFTTVAELLGGKFRYGSR